MKQRAVVMNQQKILQAEQSGRWVNESVGPAAGIGPGIYNLFSALPPDRAKPNSGIVVHVDREAVYQMVGKTLIRHAVGDMEHAPKPGEVKRIVYDASGRALVSAESATLGRGRSR